MKEASVSIVKFETPKMWALGEREVKIDKIETTTHHWTDRIPLHKELETVEPYEAAHNIIHNTGVLPNGSFFEVSPEKVMARLQDLTGSTLIRTQWIIPIHVFNSVVYDLMFSGNISESKFHIISKV